MNNIKVSNVPPMFWKEVNGNEHVIKSWVYEYALGWIEGRDLPVVMRVEDAWGWDFVYYDKVDDVYYLNDRNGGTFDVLKPSQYEYLATFADRKRGEDVLTRADIAHNEVYPRFIRSVLRQLQERQFEMEMDLEPEDRVPFVNFVDTIGRGHFDYLAEEMANDAVEMAEKEFT